MCDDGVCFFCGEDLPDDAPEGSDICASCAEEHVDGICDTLEWVFGEVVDDLRRETEAR